jgi:hypothetical protein
MFGKTRGDIAPGGRLPSPHRAHVLIRKSLSSFYLAPNFKLKITSPQTDSGNVAASSHPALLDFVVTKDAAKSVHEPAHTYAVYQTQHQERRPDARPAVTHQRQWYAGNRHSTHHHSDIHQYMK